MEQEGNNKIEELKKRFESARDTYNTLKTVFADEVLHREANGNNLFCVVKHYVEDIMETLGGGFRITHRKNRTFDIQCNVDGEFDINDFDSASEFEKWLKENNCLYLPIYALSHGGVKFNTCGFNDSWDSGLTGYIYLLPKDYEGESEEWIKEKFKGYLESIINTINKNNDNELYAVEVIHNIEDNEEGFSHWAEGFETLEEAISYGQGEIKSAS